MESGKIPMALRTERCGSTTTSRSITESWWARTIALAFRLLTRCLLRPPHSTLTGTRCGAGRTEVVWILDGIRVSWPGVGVVGGPSYLLCMRFYRLCDQRRNSSSHFGRLIEMTPKEHTCLRRPSESTWWFYSQLC